MECIRDTYSCLTNSYFLLLILHLVCVHYIPLCLVPLFKKNCVSMKISFIFSLQHGLLTDLRCSTLLIPLVCVMSCFSSNQNTKPCICDIHFHKILWCLAWRFILMLFKKFSMKTLCAFSFFPT